MVLPGRHPSMGEESVMEQKNQPSHLDFRMSKSQELLLDIVRVCMAQFIVLNHFLGLIHSKSGMGLGGLRVTVFFMLSGFLIFATTWRRKDSGYSFKDYMIDRSARLWVCLIPALIFSAVIADMTMDMPKYPAGDAAGLVQFIGNLLMLEDYPLFQILRRLGIDSVYFIQPYAAAEPYWTLPIEFWLYVVFGFLFFFVFMRQGRPSIGALALMGVALPAVLYHTATGYGQCLALVWALGCLGPWAVSADRKLQRYLAISDRFAFVLVIGWTLLCVALIVLRGLSRQLNFYEFQTVLFLAGFLMGLIWLTGRIDIDKVAPFSSFVRWLAKQSYALYLTHNAVLTLYITYTGYDFSVSEALLLIIGCNVAAMPFYFLFDRYHKNVARWLRTLPGLRAPAAMASPLK
jgi:peptidoglycan/LPS O-acetylase OafA/YrhL